MRKQPRHTAALLAVVLSGSVAAQRVYNRAQYNMLDEARLLVDAGQWSEAHRIYKRLAPLDTTFTEVLFGMGLCEANMPDKQPLAAGHLEDAVRHGHVEAQYHLALARHRQERFTEEAALLEQYRVQRGREVSDDVTARQLATAQYAMALTASPIHMRVRNLGAAINSPQHDYCPLITADGSILYFTSRRPGSMGGLKDGSGQYYEDIYTATCQDGIWNRAVNIQGPVNTAMQDATVGLSPDGNEMVIYRASEDMPMGDLYITQRSQGRWSEPERMTDKINSKAHEPSATVAPDGTEIYFTSDRPGGFGGRDLYRIRRLPNGQWSEPLNLGAKVNTPFDEDAPFLHSDGTTLFFSSNGHNTMGGFDIFKAALLDPDRNTWETPVNMGYPLNTVNDDIYFCLSEDGRTGYFSSSREGGLGGQDIHEVVFPTSQVEYILVQGVITDANESPLKARIMLTTDGTDEVFGLYNTNAPTGRYIMAVRPGKVYHMQVVAEGFEPWEHELEANDEDMSGTLFLDVPLVQGTKTADTRPSIDR
ncbi:MAG: PD40 domain-containing protein [Flavobacteriales bacterium]|nr:PD40 domain-containing protein [Flavobacteriales bacterium]MBP9080423.1 PD40 domain-containing protein [Flavobacteriales bacterium]